MTRAPALRLELSASWFLAWLILAAHAFASVSILTVLSGPVAWALAFLMMLLGIAAARDRALLRSGSAPASLVFHPDGTLICHCRDERSFALERPSPSAVRRHWVSLPAAGAVRRSLLMVGGMLPEEGFRRLRLWALWGRIPAGTPGSPRG